jgi:hypothetical protein
MFLKELYFKTPCNSFINGSSLNSLSGKGDGAKKRKYGVGQVSNFYILL